MARQLPKLLAFALLALLPGAAFAQGILSADTRAPEVIAEEVLSELWVDIQVEPRYATCFLGELILDGSKLPNANGAFTFAGFYCRQPSKSGGSAVRMWSTRDVTVPDEERRTIEFIPDFDTHDRLSSDGDIYYINRGGNLIKGGVDDQAMRQKNRRICLDSRLAMVEFAKGILGGSALDIDKKRFIVADDSPLSATRADGKIIAVVQGLSPDFFFHMTLDPKYGYRPSKVAVTKGTQVLEPGDANAMVINELRWQKIGERWIAVAGRNLQFGQARTKADHDSSVLISWQAAWWFGDDVDSKFVDTKEMSPESSVLFAKFDQQLETVSQVEPFSDPASE